MRAAPSTPIVFAIGQALVVMVGVNIGAGNAVRAKHIAWTGAGCPGSTHSTPFGNVTYRALDHQSTMGAYVGRIAVKDGKGVMVDWRFIDGKDALPSDDEVKKLRPAN